MREGRTDIQSDPVLYKACSLDVKRFCGDIPFGRGKGTVSLILLRYLSHLPLADPVHWVPQSGM